MLIVISFHLVSSRVIFLLDKSAQKDPPELFLSIKNLEDFSLSPNAKGTNSNLSLRINSSMNDFRAIS